MTEPTVPTDAELEVLVDGGVRSGVDVFRALALGAQGVLIGRPWAWALAAGGESTLTELLQRWQHELTLAMTLAGVTRVAECGPGKVLTGLVKRIDKAIDGRSLATPGDFEAAREAWSA